MLSTDHRRNCASNSTQYESIRYKDSTCCIAVACYTREGEEESVIKPGALAPFHEHKLWHLQTEAAEQATKVQGGQDTVDERTEKASDASEEAGEAEVAEEVLDELQDAGEDDLDAEEDGGEGRVDVLEQGGLSLAKETRERGQRGTHDGGVGGNVLDDAADERVDVGDEGCQELGDLVLGTVVGAPTRQHRLRC